MLLTLGVLLVAVVLSVPLTRWLGRGAGWPLAALYLAAAGLAVPPAMTVAGGTLPAFRRPWVPPLGVEFAFRADGLSVVFTFMALLVGAVVFAYSARYLGEGRHLSFYLVMTGFTFAMVALSLADNLLLFFLCWELTSLASFMLIARSGRPGEHASMRTLLVTFTGGLALLTAVVLIADRTGTSTLSSALASPVWRDDTSFTALVAVLVAIAGFSKAAQFPFHIWLPDAMAAPTPVSAYLHAAAVVKAGIFVLMRFSPALHDNGVWNTLLISSGLVTALLGGRFALEQTDLKRLMAYSTVSQLGLIVATIGIGTETALMAATLHTIAHALFKSGLFMMVGVVDHATGTRDMRRLPPHLWRLMPFSFGVTTLGAAAMAGIPPLLGFVSKESVLTAMLGAPGPAWTGPVAFLVTALASVLTFAYCVKIVLGAFVDGREDRQVKHAERGLVSIAMVPIAAGLPLGVAVFLFDPIVTRAAQAALPELTGKAHFTLWHGVTVELLTTLGIFALGTAFALTRRRWYRMLERRSFPFDGPTVLAGIRDSLRRGGLVASRPQGADRPARHLVLIVSAFVAVMGVGGLVTAQQPAPPSLAGWGQPVDAIVGILMLLAVVSVCRSPSRLGATVSLSAIGMLAVVQIVALGAPDVMLTQLLVESLTIIVIMLVLQRLPRTFGKVSTRHRARTLIIALAAGASAGLGTWLLTGRRPRSEVGLYYLEHAKELTGGENVVNVILVEFRALDTFGEVTVLGMTGIAVVALLSSVRSKHIDPGPDVDHRAKPPELDLRPGAATRALYDPWPNAIPLQLVVRLLVPVLMLLSAMIFWRGHNSPGGGFIAALVGGCAVALLYLSTSRDRQIGPPRLPVYLIGGGIVGAIGVGLWGALAKGSFLTPIHGYVFGIHVTTSMLFDLGVYAAVLGLLLITFNLLGASEDAAEDPQSESTRERADETVEGELPGPLDSVRGEPARVGVGTGFLANNEPPREVGR